MTLNTLSASLIALTFAALPLAAQTAGDAQASGDSTLSMGQADAAVPGAGLPTQDTAEVGKIYYVTNFDNWEERCKKTADGADPCNLFQLLTDGTGNPVAQVNLFPLPQGQEAVAGANIMVPLETLLTKNLALAIDGAPAKTYPYAFCTKDGCVARIGFTADEVAAMKKGSVVKVGIVPAAAPDKTVGLELSLKGFTAGYEAVVASRAKP